MAKSEIDIHNSEHDTDLLARRVVNLNDLIPSTYDYIELTYVGSGNGVGQIETVTYKTGGASGTTVGTLTLAYNGSDKLSSITKT